jgi:hypothetical protein
MFRPGSHTVSMPIAADATGKEGHVVVLNAANQVALAVNATARPFGVIQHVSEDGLTVEVLVSGLGRGRVGDALTAGTSLMLQANISGKMVPQVVAAGNFATGMWVGQKVDAADGDLVDIVFSNEKVEV